VYVPTGSDFVTTVNDVGAWSVTLSQSNCVVGTAIVKKVCPSGNSTVTPADVPAPLSLVSCTEGGVTRTPRLMLMV
jgi:hypothetical protein